MRILSEKHRLLGWLSVFLLLGFLGTSINSYIVASDTARRQLVEQALPQVGDHLYSEIKMHLLRPTLLASAMAHNTFLREWLTASGEADPAPILRYLSTLRQDYGANASFLVAERTRQYYLADTAPRLLQENDPHDQWYFQARAAQAPLPAQISVDPVQRDKMIVVARQRVLDGNGALLGVAGLSMPLDALTALIDRFQAHPGRQIYLLNAQGMMVAAGSAPQQAPLSIHQHPGLRTVAGRILNQSTTPVRTEYQLGETPVFTHSRFIPELGWYVLVAQHGSAQAKTLQQMLLLNLLFGLAVIAICLTITLFGTNRYEQRLQRIAGSDPLTGLLNRQAFEMLFKQAALESGRSTRPLSVVLFDVDFLQQVNDTYGHQAGDEVLRILATLAKSVVRESDSITRWGGEEFAILLKECALERAVLIAEKVRDTIANHDFSAIAPDLVVTVSLGIAQYEGQESAVSFFTRADQALAHAKNNGRNRIQVAVAPSKNA